MRQWKKDSSIWVNDPLGSVYSKCPKKLVEPEEVRRIMWQALNGLKFLHENNIVHRDVKPHNILVNRLRHVKLSDMGLSK